VAAAAAVMCLAVAAASAQGDASSAPSRYRAAIAALLQLKPGMTVAEVGSTPGVLAPELTLVVGRNGRVIAGTLDRKTGAITIEPAPVDAIALVTVFGATDRPKDVIERAAAALKSGGALLVVDVPQENDGRKVVGLEAEDVVQLATAAGLRREAESGIVPGHYSIRFRKP
jgi:precorrin-6B methylase 2